MINLNDSTYVISWNSLKPDIACKLIWKGKPDKVITYKDNQIYKFLNDEEDY